MKEIIDEYKIFLAIEKRLSMNTCNSYVIDIKMYSDYLNKKNIYNYDDIKTEDIKNYLKILKRNNIKNSTISRKITTIKSFHKFLYINKYTINNEAAEIDKPKNEQKLPTIFSIQEISNLLDHFTNDSPTNYRDKLMAEIAYTSGLRVSELVNLKITDFHIDSNFMKVLGKGSKERLVPFTNTIKKMLQDYVNNHRNKILYKKHNKTDYLFINGYGQPISRNMFFITLKKKCDESGITKSLSPHTLRHSFASHLLENGMELRLIQELLGHANIATTEIYTHVSKVKITEVFLKAHPHANKNNE